MSIRYSNPGFIWQPAPPRFCARMGRILAEWEDTPYMSGQQLKGEHADCIGFVFQLIDELLGVPSGERKKLPPDSSMHNRSLAMAAMRELLRLYPSAKRVEDGVVKPGRIILTGHSDGGPGHVMIAGPRKNTLWHCNPGIGVKQTGFAFAERSQSVYGIYRITDLESQWT